MAGGMLRDQAIEKNGFYLWAVFTRWSGGK
jgi:hypothetical protein